MIFDVKQQDLRRKTRLLIGSHVIESSIHTVYSSNIQSVSVHLIIIVAAKTGLNLMEADIANAYVMAPCWEKIWSRAGPDFRDKIGSIVMINRSLYGLAISGRVFLDSRIYWGLEVIHCNYISYTSNIILYNYVIIP